MKRPMSGPSNATLARATPTGSWWRPKLRPDLALLQVLFFAGLFVMPDGMRCESATDSRRRRTMLPFPGWKTSPHETALAAFRKSCGEIMADGRAFRRAVTFGGVRRGLAGRMREGRSCRRRARLSSRLISRRSAFRTRFVPQGLFTGYYEPEAIGSLKPDARFTVPIYGKPDDLSGSRRRGFEPSWACLWPHRRGQAGRLFHAQRNRGGRSRRTRSRACLAGRLGRMPSSSKSRARAASDCPTDRF